MTKNQRGGKGKRSIKSRPAIKHGSKPIQRPMTVLGQQNTKGAVVTKKGSKDVTKGFKRDKRNKEFEDQVLQLEERNMGKGRKPGGAKVVAMAITLQPSLLQETMRQTHQQPTIHYADTLLEGEAPESSHVTNNNVPLPSNQQQRPTGAMTQNRGQHVNKFAVLDDDDSDEDGDQPNKKYQLQLQPSLLGNLSSFPAAMGSNEDDDDDL